MNRRLAELTPDAAASIWLSLSSTSLFGPIRRTASRPTPRGISSLAPKGTRFMPGVFALGDEPGEGRAAHGLPHGVRPNQTNKNAIRAQTNQMMLTWQIEAPRNRARAGRSLSGSPVSGR